MSTGSKATTYLAVVLIIAGFVLMALAWNGAANYDNPQQQFPYLLSGSMPGLGLVMAGLTLALVQELRRLTARLLARLESLGGVVVEAAPAPAVVTTDASEVVAAGTAFHTPDCALVEGRSDLATMTAAEASRKGLTPCRICEPKPADEAA
jgi:hypothetical protein